MKKILLILLFSCAFLSAKEEETPYLTSERDTLALVEGVVNAYNGKLVQIDQDIEIQGSDPLEMTRYYDGGHHFDSEFGYGVGCSYPAILRLSWNGKKSLASLELRMGCEVLFEVKKDKNKGKEHLGGGGVSKDYFKSGYTNCCEALLHGEPSIYAMHMEAFTDQAIVTLGNGTKRYYDPYKVDLDGSLVYLLRLEERNNGNRRHFSYNKDKGPFRLKRIWTTNREGNLTLNWLDFDDQNLHMKVKGSNGQEAHYIKQVEKGKAKGGNVFSGYETKFTKVLLREASSDNYPATQYDVIKRARYSNTIFSVCKVRKSNGQFLEVEYDSNEKVKKLCTSGSKLPLYTFDYHSDSTQVVDARGAKKKFEFNKRRLTKLTEEHRLQTYAWDDKGQLISHTIQTPAGAQVSQRTYQYDERGNILEIKLQGDIAKKDVKDSVITRYTYSKEDNLIFTENHNDEVEYVYYYLSGTNLLARKFTIISNKILEREFYSYDKNGILVSKIVDDGYSSEQQALDDVSYRLVTEIEPQLNPAVPGMTLPHFIREWYLDPQTGKKHLIKKIERLYTQGDLLAEEKVFDSSDTYRYSLHYAYNHRRELVSETNALGEKTLYRYDDSGNKIYEEKVGSGKKTHFVYNAANLLKEEREEHLDRQLIKTYEYDALGNRLSSTDIYGQKTLYQYDLSSREISCTDPLGHIERKEYDPQGNITKYTDKDGHTTETCYNIFGDPFEIRYPDGSCKKFAYNRRGHLVQEWNRDGTSIVYQVDFKGRVQKAQTQASDGSHLKTLSYEYIYDLNDNLLKVEDLIHQKTTSRTYDSLNRMIYEKQATGFEFEFSYDDLNRITKMTFCEGFITYDYSPLHLIAASRYKDNQLLYTYTQQLDAHGKIQQATLPNQTSVVYHWDKMGRCELIDSPAFQQNLTYDVLGNLTQTEVQDGIGSYKAAFTYDGLNQLISEVSPFQNNYQYDSLRNRRGKNGASHSIDTLNHLLHDSLQDYQQDLTGRRTRKGDAHYSFDALGRLTAFHQGSAKIEFQYDPFGRRLACLSPDSTVYYLYQLDTEIGAHEQGKLSEFRLTHKQATLALELNGKCYTPIRNPRGDICQLQDGQVPAVTYRYDAFGVYTHEGTISSPWLFSGQRYDSTTALYHFDKREYDPHNGRWLTPDPLGFAEGPNLFAYVNNNPLIYVDPYGLWREEVKDFLHGSSRGFVDDTSWNASSHLLGNYRSTSTAGNWGYHLGTGASMAASVLYGGAEVRLLKGAFTGIRKIPTLLNFAKKPLRETHNIVKATSHHTPLKQIFEQAKSSEKVAAKGGMRQTSTVETVIQETLKGSGDITSQIKLSADEALRAGMRFL